MLDQQNTINYAEMAHCQKLGVIGLIGFKNSVKGVFVYAF